MSDTPTYDELLRTCEDLRLAAARAISTKQELITTKQALDAELGRYRQIQRYVERALPLDDLEAFAGLTAETLVEAYDLEAALLALVAEAPGTARVIGACGLARRPDTIPLEPAWTASGVALHGPGSDAVRAWAPLSACDILCFPLHGAAGELLGVLAALRTIDGARFYPELPTDASTGVLAHQAAALLRNLQARATIRRQVDELHESLRVQQRSEALRLAEAQRAAHQQEVIELQRETLRQLESPVLRVYRGVLAVPIVGSIDHERARLLVDSLLAAVQAQRAATVLVDLTGLHAADAEAVAMLARMTGAVRLLGAEVVLSGVRPDIAGALVDLGADLGKVAVVADLGAAISRALARARR